MQLEHDERELPENFIENVKRYDLDSLRYLVHAQGSSTHLKYVFRIRSSIETKDKLEKLLHDFAALNKLSQDAKIPAIFLINYRHSMICGILHNRQLLVVDPSGWRSAVNSSAAALCRMLSALDYSRIEKLYICRSAIVNESNAAWSGALCVELMKSFEDCYEEIPEKFKCWEKISQGRVGNNLSNVLFHELDLEEIIDNSPLTRMVQVGEVVSYSNIGPIIENQINGLKNLLLSQRTEKKPLDMQNNSLLQLIQMQVIATRKNSEKITKYLDHNLNRALWQIVVHWLSTAIDQGTLVDNENAYAKLLDVIVKMNTQGPAEIYNLLQNVQRASGFFLLMDDDSLGENECLAGHNPIDLIELLSKSYWQCNETLDTDILSFDDSMDKHIGIDQMSIRANPVSSANSNNEPGRMEIDFANVELESNSPRLENPDSMASELFPLIAQGALDKFSECLERDPTCLCKRGAKDAVALHAAVSFNDPSQIRLEIIKLILEHDPDLTVVMTDGSTPLHLAAKATNAVVVVELLFAHILNQYVLEVREKIIQHLIPSVQQDVDLYQAIYGEIVEATDQIGMTPLHYAFACGNLDTAECLLIHGASLVAKDSIYNVSPLFLCFKMAPIKVIEKALALFLAYANQQQIKQVFNETDDKGNTLMHYVCLHGSYRLVQTLVRLHAPANDPNHSSQTPSQWLTHPESSESGKIVACLLGLPVKEDDILYLANYPSKNPERYLRKILNLLPPRERGKQILPKASDGSALANEVSVRISAPSGFAKMYSSFSAIPSNMTALSQELDDGIAGFFSAIEQLNTAADNLKLSDKKLYSKLHCESYLSAYRRCMAISVESDFIYALLTMSPNILEKHSVNCRVILAQYSSMIDELSSRENELSIQTIIVNSRHTFLGRSIDDLETVFPAHDPRVLALIAKDKSCYDMFALGLSALYESHKEVLKNNTTVQKLFTSLQKLIAIIQVIQQFFKASVNQGQGSNVSEIVIELRGRMIAAVNVALAQGEVDTFASTAHILA